MPRKNGKHQCGGRYSSLYGPNLPLSSNTPSSSCHSGCGWALSSPSYTGHGTVGRGLGKGLNYGAAHYGLPLVGGSSHSESADSEGGAIWDTVRAAMDYESLEDYLQSEEDDMSDQSDDQDNKQITKQNGKQSTKQNGKQNSKQSGGNSGDFSLPLRWFSPSSASASMSMAGGRNIDSAIDNAIRELQDLKRSRRSFSVDQRYTPDEIEFFEEIADFASR